MDHDGMNSALGNGGERREGMGLKHTLLSSDLQMRCLARTLIRASLGLML